jgi:hypothetical protein
VSRRTLVTRGRDGMTDVPAAAADAAGYAHAPSRGLRHDDRRLRDRRCSASGGGTAGSAPTPVAARHRVDHDAVDARDVRAGSTFQSEIDGAMWQAVNGVTAWPAHDLFASFP